jgi:hypothetical protein
VLARPAPGGTRDASASDPTALPGVWALGVGKAQPRRLPAPASASGARSLRRDGTADPRGGVLPHRRPAGTRTLRRNGSVRPRGGVHHHPPVCRGRAGALPPSWILGLLDPPQSTSGGGNSIRQAGASGHASRDRGDPACGPGRGIGDAACCGHRGALAWDALSRRRRDRGRGSLGAQRVPPAAGRASDEGPRTRLAKQKPSRSDYEQGGRSKPAGQERSRHAVARKKRAAHPLGKTKAVTQ